MKDYTELIKKIDESIKRADSYVEQNTTLTDSIDKLLASYVLQWYGEGYESTFDWFAENPLTLSEIETSIKFIKKLRKSKGLSPIGCDTADREAVRDAAFIIKGMRTPEELEYPVIGEFITKELSK